MKTSEPKPEETTQLSGLSDFELQVEKLVDEIKVTQSTLECISILKWELQEYAEVFHKEKLREELIKFVKQFYTNTEICEYYVDEHLKTK